MFHISVLKKVVGQELPQLSLPTKAYGAHPILSPQAILGSHRIWKGNKGVS